MKKTNKKTLAFTLGLSFFASSSVVLASSLESAYQDSLKQIEEAKKLEKIHSNKAINEAQKENVEVQIELLQAMKQLEDLKNPKEESEGQGGKVTIDNFLKFEESYTAEQFEEDSYELEVGGQDYGINYEQIQKDMETEAASSRFDAADAPKQESYVSGMGKSPSAYGNLSLSAGQSLGDSSGANGEFSPSMLEDKRVIDSLLSSKEMMSKIEAMVNERVHEVATFNADKIEEDGEDVESEGSDEPVVVSPSSFSANEYMSRHSVAMRNYVKIGGRESVDLFVFQDFNDNDFLNKRTKVGDSFVVDSKVSGVLKELNPEYIVVELTYDDGKTRLIKNFKGSFHTQD